MVLFFSSSLLLKWKDKWKKGEKKEKQNAHTLSEDVVAYQMKQQVEKLDYKYALSSRAVNRPTRNASINVLQENGDRFHVAKKMKWTTEPKVIRS